MTCVADWQPRRNANDRQPASRVDYERLLHGMRSQLDTAREELAATKAARKIVIEPMTREPRVYERGE